MDGKPAAMPLPPVFPSFQAAVSGSHVMLQEVIEFLRGAQTFFVATTDGEHPHVRPFGFVMEYNGLLCFCTGNQKAVYRQLQTNPHCEVCAMNASGEWLRVEGTALFLTDHRAKEKVFEVMPQLVSMYHDADNPVLQVFALTDLTATVYAFGEGGITQRALMAD